MFRHPFALLNAGSKKASWQKRRGNLNRAASHIYEPCSVKAALILIAVSLVIGGKTVSAAEGGSGLYLLGYQGSFAGVLSSPGIYFKTDIDYYDGKASTVVRLGRVEADFKARSIIETVNLTYVTKFQILGGTWAVSAVPTWGYVSLEAIATSPDETVRLDDWDYGLADLPITPIVLGWHRGNFHYLASVTVYLPVGEYDLSKKVNIGKNHWAFEPAAAFTWFNRERGHEVSLALGYTINLENEDTDYKTGDEFHADFAAAKHFPSGLAVGVGGYAYNQVTDDRGDGAVLGEFKGQVYALGPQLSYSFGAGLRSFSLTARYFKEFEAKNRLEGDSFWASLGFSF